MVVSRSCRQIFGVLMSCAQGMGGCNKSTGRPLYVRSRATDELEDSEEMKRQVGRVGFDIGAYAMCLSSGSTDREEDRSLVAGLRIDFSGMRREASKGRCR